MDRIFGISRALDYIEQHITEPTDYEAIAKCAYCSSFHFQRIFSVICDMAIGDYVRMRRLALAGEELSAENAKVIDVALTVLKAFQGHSQSFTVSHRHKQKRVLP